MAAEQGTRVDVVVLGGGAAGLMAAFEASRRGRRVLLVEHGERVGRKILISGGGRCNFTNLRVTAENFLSENPHFAKSALARFAPAEMVELVRRHGIRFHEKTLGQLFCDDSARQIVTLLEKECGEAGVQIRCGVSLSAVRLAGSGPARFVVETSVGEIGCEAVIVATGGLSIPKMGATAFGYELARSFGHEVIEPRAALVPLVLTPEDRERWCDLTGLSAEVVAQAEKTGRQRPPAFQEKMLVTHRGLSGPAVLQASSYWKPGAAVVFDLAPGRDVLAPLLAKNARRDAAAMLAVLRVVLPSRMAERWVELQAGSD
jgi:predicted Rossmann fold flavoprotein